MQYLLHDRTEAASGERRQLCYSPAMLGLTMTCYAELRPLIVDVSQSVSILIRSRPLSTGYMHMGHELWIYTFTALKLHFF